MDRGDEVIVVMADNHVFPWQGSPKWRAELRAAPAGPGDVFTLRIAEPANEYHKDISEYVGRDVYLNGNSSEFVGLYPADSSVV